MSRVLAVFAVVVSVVVVACGGETQGAVRIQLVPGIGDTRAAIDVVNLDDDTVRRLRDSDRSADGWQAVMRVAVAQDQPPMLGSYAVVGRALRFTPAFPLDPGREYHVSFSASAISGASRADAPRVSAVVALPARTAAPSTVVSHVFPSTGVVPENQLRLYIHFSAPMSRRGGLEHVRLLGGSGHEVVDPFLPLDAEFWNGDRTRYTVFFDPGRQKRGILPNQQMGRSLEPGQRYTLVVSREWRDAEGLPLAADFRREFTVGPADERPLDTQSWRIEAPVPDTRDPLVVSFPEPLDHGLLLRALGVTGRDGVFIDGDVVVEAGESRWRFTPRAPWAAGAHQLVALAMLEDLAGNRIGRAFEVDNFDRADRTPEPERTTMPFVVSRRDGPP
jgi:hypothetical protein